MYYFLNSTIENLFISKSTNSSRNWTIQCFMWSLL